MLLLKLRLLPDTTTAANTAGGNLVVTVPNAQAGAVLEGFGLDNNNVSTHPTSFLFGGTQFVNWPAGASVTNVRGTNTTVFTISRACLLYTSPSPRDATLSRMPSSA